jgi:hypothetical protein
VSRACQPQLQPRSSWRQADDDQLYLVTAEAQGILEAT